MTKKKNAYQLERKQSAADQKKIRDAERAEYQAPADYDPLFKKLNKEYPIDRTRYK